MPFSYAVKCFDCCSWFFHMACMANLWHSSQNNKRLWPLLFILIFILLPTEQMSSFLYHSLVLLLEGLFCFALSNSYFLLAFLFLFILSHFFEHFFPSAPFLFPPSAPASSEALMIFWERCPLGFICFCSLLYFPWNKTTLTDAKQMNLCCAYYSACIVHISTPQFKQNRANIHFWKSSEYIYMGPYYHWLLDLLNSFWKY